MDETAQPGNEPVGVGDDASVTPINGWQPGSNGAYRDGNGSRPDSAHRVTHLRAAESPWSSAGAALEPTVEPASNGWRRSATSGLRGRAEIRSRYADLLAPVSPALPPTARPREDEVPASAPPYPYEDDPPPTEANHRAWAPPRAVDRPPLVPVVEHPTQPDEYDDGFDSFRPSSALTDPTFNDLPALAQAAAAASRAAVAAQAASAGVAAAEAKMSVEDRAAVQAAYQAAATGEPEAPPPLGNTASPGNTAPPGKGVPPGNGAPAAEESRLPAEYRNPPQVPAGTRPSSQPPIEYRPPTDPRNSGQAPTDLRPTSLPTEFRAQAGGATQMYPPVNGTAGYRPVTGNGTDPRLLANGMRPPVNGVPGPGGPDFRSPADPRAQVNAPVEYRPPSAPRPVGVPPTEPQPPVELRPQPSGGPRPPQPVGPRPQAPAEARPATDPRASDLRASAPTGFRPPAPQSQGLSAPQSQGPPMQHGPAGFRPTAQATGGTVAVIRPVSATPVSAAPVSATPISGLPVSAIPSSSPPVSGLPVSGLPPLPQRVPAPPDVPDVPEDGPDDQVITAEELGRPAALARIATGLRYNDDLQSEPEPRTDGFDFDAVLTAVRQVSGVSDAKLKANPGGVHTLRLDLDEGADPGLVSRLVARLLKQRMGLAAEPRRATPAARVPNPPGITEAAPSPVASPVASPVVSPVVEDRSRPRQPVAPSRRHGVTESRPEDVEPRRPIRPGLASQVILDQVQVSTLGLEATVEVRLSGVGGPAIGVANGPAVDGYVLRLAAEAATVAIDQLLSRVTGSQQGRSYVEHAAVVPFGSCEVAVVVILLVHGGAAVEQLTGSALVSGDPRQAVVRATLAAVSRRLDALLG